MHGIFYCLFDFCDGNKNVIVTAFVLFFKNNVRFSVYVVKTNISW